MLWLSIFLVLFTVLFAVPITNENEEVTPLEDIQILTKQGSLVGSRIAIGSRGSYYAFKGIPYAEPPIGDFRFRAPRPHLGWSPDVFDARNHGSICAQDNEDNGGSEDCLFVNVYTPELNKSLPVMVWIHGGAYVSGSGNSLTYGPENLVQKDVIVVTFNYRLGFFGFFSTGDRHAQGNYALKDCVEVLYWIQENIASYGGNPNQVTIFGESSGGVIANMLVLSPAARGLFHGAISQSGVPISPVSFQPRPREIAFGLARRMGLQATTTEGIVAELREITEIKRFTNEFGGLNDIPVPRAQSPYRFGPCVETEFLEPPFFTQHPLDILKAGTWTQVPYIIGANSHEALYSVIEPDIDPDIFSKWEQHPEYLLPYSWNITPGTPEANEIITSLQDLYFEGGSVKEMSDYIDYNSDTHFLYGTYKTVKMMAAKHTKSIYYYNFRFSGTLNIYKNALLLLRYPGAMHGDDVGYLFRVNSIPVLPVIPGSATERTRNRMVEMWTNFAKTGNPTPEITSLLSTKWNPVGSNQEYLLIDNELTNEAQPNEERMKLWTYLDDKYGP